MPNPDALGETPPLPEECCAKCRFCTMPPPEARLPPICRRYPPTPHIAKFFWDESGNQTVGNAQVAVFPYVVPQGWCGEFKRAPALVN